MTDHQDLARQDNIQEEQSPLKAYNTALIKKYLKSSRCSAVAFVVIWLLFLVECLLTWIKTKGGVYGPSSISPEVLITMGANVPLLVKLGGVHRLVTAMFLHAGILHIIMNSASLIAFCAQVESTVTLPLYLAVYIVGGIQGNMLSDLYNLTLGNHSVIAIGASTSICAVMGLYMANLYLQSRKNGTVKLAKKQIVSMLIYLFVISLVPGVDFFGHFGSLFGGLLIGAAVLSRGDPELRKIQWISTVLFILYTLMLLRIFF